LVRSSALEGFASLMAAQSEKATNPPFTARASFFLATP
jgi:hypothetical protein